MTSSPARRGGLYVAFVREPDDRGTKARRRTVRRVRQHFDNDSPGHANLEAKVEPARVVVVVVGDLEVLLDPLLGQIVRSCGAQAHRDEEDAEEAPSRNVPVAQVHDEAERYQSQRYTGAHDGDEQADAPRQRSTQRVIEAPDRGGVLLA